MPPLLLVVPLVSVPVVRRAPGLVAQIGPLVAEPRVARVGRGELPVVLPAAAVLVAAPAVPVNSVVHRAVRAVVVATVTNCSRSN